MDNNKINHTGFINVEKRKTNKFKYALYLINQRIDIRKTYFQIGVCTLILVCVLALKAMNTPFSNEVISDVNAVLNGEIEIDEDLGRLKFVSKQTKAVYNEGITLPIEATSNDMGFEQKTLMILGKENEPVFATFSGVVEEKSENEIVIIHESGIKSVYKGLLPTSFVGDEVLSGQAVGYLRQKYLQVNIMYEDEYLDPDEFLKDLILR